MDPYAPRLKDSCLLCLISLSLFLLFGYSQGQEPKYPSRPITFIQPFSAGTTTDLAIRLITKEAENFLGQPIVVVNKPGGYGGIGLASIATSKPDGYTIGNAGVGPMIFLPLLEKMPYDPLKDVRLIIQFAAFNMGVIVKGESSFKSFKDLIDYARQNPRKLTYGTAGAMSSQFIIMEQIAKKEKVQFTHIPFKSMTEVQTAVMGGHLLFGAGDFNYSLVEAGEMRLLLLFRDEQAVEYPQTPILKDQGYDLAFPTFITVSGPRGLPEGIVKKLEEAFTQATKEPAFTKGMKELRLPVVYRNSQELGDYVARNYRFFAEILKEMGLIK